MSEVLPPEEKKPAAKAPSLYDQSKALAVRGDSAGAVPMPTTFAQMQDFASAMSKAEQMIGKPFRNSPGACLAILTQAMRWGMDPYAVSQKAYVSASDADIAQGKGAIAYEGQLIAAVVQKLAPLQKRLRCEYEGDGDERRIIVTGWLVGEDEPFEYRSPTVAKLRKPLGKGSPLWYDDPDQQLWYYGVRGWARKWTPDVILGVYSRDEMDGVARTGGAAIEGGTISLSEDLDQGSASQDLVQDADFTDVSTLLNKTAAAPDDPAEDGGREDASREASSNSAEAGAAAAKDDGSGAPADSEDDPPSDEEILKAIEGAKPVKTKAQAVTDSIGALRRIAETGEPDLAKRAQALLAAYGPKG